MITARSHHQAIDQFCQTRYCNDDMEDLTFAQEVRDLRARHNVGREVIAERANLAVNTVRNAELGTPTMVTNLRRILRGMGYDLKIVRFRKPRHASGLKASDAA